MTTLEKLHWGAAALVPEDAPAAWGARLIVTQTGDTDLVPDRQDAVGDEKVRAELIDYLNGGKYPKPKDETPFRSALKQLSEMLKDYRVRTDKAEDVTVYEDDKILVRGNSNGSYGYFYIAAWLKGEK